MVSIDFLDARLPQNLQFIQNAVSVKRNKVKCNDGAMNVYKCCISSIISISIKDCMFSV